MGLVAAKCPQCGANIEVDSNNDAGICKYCGTPFITEKAINNYITNVTNNYSINADKLVLGGIDENKEMQDILYLLFEAREIDWKKIKEKADKIYDYNPRNELAFEIRKLTSDSKVPLNILYNIVSIKSIDDELKIKFVNLYYQLKCSNLLNLNDIKFSKILKQYFTEKQINNIINNYILEIKKAKDSLFTVEHKLYKDDYERINCSKAYCIAKREQEYNVMVDLIRAYEKGIKLYASNYKELDIPNFKTAQKTKMYILKKN